MAEKSSEKRASGMRSAERLLIVLRALNLRNGATVLELNRDTGISRQAIYRILDTLRNFGYVRRQEATDRFHLTHMVRRLSSGFKDEEWIADIAVPILGRLVQEVVWPTELSTFSDNAMYIRESTRGRSPFTIDRVAVGQRLPMLQSASGRAYLSYCPDPEREAIIENLKSSDDDFDQVAHKPDYIERILAATRSRGWAVGDDSFRLHPKTETLAVPVLVNGYARASLPLTYIASAATAEQIAERHMSQLQAAAKEIADRMEEMQARTDDDDDDLIPIREAS